MYEANCGVQFFYKTWLMKVSLKLEIYVIPNICCKMKVPNICSKMKVPNICCKMKLPNKCCKIKVPNICSKMKVPNICCKMKVPNIVIKNCPKKETGKMLIYIHHSLYLSTFQPRFFPSHSPYIYRYIFMFNHLYVNLLLLTMFIN